MLITYLSRCTSSHYCLFPITLLAWFRSHYPLYQLTLYSCIGSHHFLFHITPLWLYESSSDSHNQHIVSKLSVMPYIVVELHKSILPQSPWLSQIIIFCIKKFVPGHTINVSSHTIFCTGSHYSLFQLTLFNISGLKRYV